MYADVRAQSESIGAILLVGVVTLSLSVYGVYYFGTLTDRNETAAADVTGAATLEGVTLTHQAGDAVPESALEVRLFVNGTEWTNVTWASGTVRGTDDGQFAPGERWRWDDGNFSDGDVVRLLLIDTESNDVLFDGTLRPGAAGGGAGGGGGLAAPSPTFTVDPDTGPSGTTFAFDASGTTDPDGGPVTAYSWNFDDGATGSGKTVNHTYSDDGTYSVTLTVVDDDGQTAQTTKSVTVQNRPPTASFVTPPGNETVDEPVEFDARGSSDPDDASLTYRWDFDDGNVTTTSDPIIDHTYEQAGDYEVTLTVTDDDGASDTRTKTVTVEQVGPPNGRPAFADPNRNGEYDDGETTYTSGQLTGFDRDVHLVVARDVSESQLDISARTVTVTDGVTMETTNGAVKVYADAELRADGATFASSSGNELLLDGGTSTSITGAALDSGSKVTVLGGGVDATDAVLKSASGSEVNVDARSGTAAMTNADVDSGAKVTISGEGVDVTGATVGSASGNEVKLDARSGTATLSSATVTSGSKVTVTGNGIDAGSAAVTSASGSEIQFDAGGSTVTLSDANVDSGSKISVSGDTLVADDSSLTTASGSELSIGVDGTADVSGAILDSGAKVNIDASEVDATDADISSPSGSEVKITTSGTLTLSDASIDSGSKITVTSDDRVTGPGATLTTPSGSPIVVDATNGVDFSDGTLDAGAKITLTTKGDIDLRQTIVRGPQSSQKLATLENGKGALYVEGARILDDNGGADVLDLDAKKFGKQKVGTPAEGSVQKA